MFSEAVECSDLCGCRSARRVSGNNGGHVVANVCDSIAVYITIEFTEGFRDSAQAPHIVPSVRDRWNVDWLRRHSWPGRDRLDRDRAVICALTTIS